MAELRRQVVPGFLEGREKEHLRKISNIVNDLQKGRGNNHFDVTLVANATQTTIVVDWANAQSLATFHARSASAAQAIAAGAVWTEVNKGEIVIHHDSQPATDRQLGVVLIG
jgi:hypothetical protein